MKRVFFAGILSLSVFLNNIASADVTTQPAATANQFTAVVVKGVPMDTNLSIGVSAAGVGVIDNTIIVAGGTNFKDNVAGKIGEQRYFKDIYGAVLKGNAKKLKWIKLNEFVEPLAYSANVVANNALYLIGGSNSSGDKAGFIEIKFVNGALVKDTISYLPVLVTKAGGAAVGDYVYVVGGFQNGKPSNDMYRINLKDIKKGWQKVASYPEDARIQPVVASQKDASGKAKLYMWGGYLPKQGKYSPIPSCGGYKYDPDKNAWSPLGAPLNKEEQRVYLGGGCLAPIGEDKIIAFGGADFETLLVELNGKDEKYYQHEPSWYKLNQEAYSFDTKTNKWQSLGANPSFAKINAGVSVNSNSVYSLWGEIKPGTTTNLSVRADFK